jgi:hypothetical protein
MDTLNKILQGRYSEHEDSLMANWNSTVARLCSSAEFLSFEQGQHLGTICTVPYFAIARQNFSRKALTFMHIALY